MENNYITHDSLLEDLNNDGFGDLILEFDKDHSHPQLKKAIFF